MSDVSITNLGPPDRRPLGEAVMVEAVDVQAEDFTTATGLRRVIRAEHVYHTSGRGKKKTTSLVAVRLHRIDGTSDEVFPDADILVRRRISA